MELKSIDLAQKERLQKEIRQLIIQNEVPKERRRYFTVGKGLRRKKVKSL